ncbi:Gfo/Idh/MocA family oxidoreductase [Variovorax ureilyticus]|uniref:Gfo/Idh/MocA family oxidoreductase n=1 Tax=Variovorax ureilyticus TaxID=1836198 RepID=A0ABU8VEN4_9BURK
MTFVALDPEDFRSAPVALSASPPSDDAPLIHAIVGLGRFGTTHARKLAGLSGFRLRATVDPAEAAADCAELAALPRLAAVDHLPPDVQSATVATSDAAHAPVAQALMRRGCHVLVEKPLCTERRDGALMIRTAQQYGVTLSTGHIERFNPVFDDLTLTRLRHMARAHRHGTHPFLRFRRYSSRDAGALDSVLDLMVHDLDLFAWLCAIPTDAPMQVLARRICARHVRARVRLGDWVADLESGYGSAPANARMQAGHESRPLVLDLRSRAHPALTGDDALARQYRDFRRAVHGRGRRIASGADGLAAVTRACQILEA